MTSSDLASDEQTNAGWTARRTAVPPSARDFINPLLLLRSLVVHRDLIWQFTIRDLLQRYKGSHLGLLWSPMTPLMLLAVYSFVFGVIFPGGRFAPDGHEASRDTWATFPLALFAGLILFNIFAETVNRSPGLVVGSANYVKKVVFPLEVLGVSALGVSLIQGVISLGVFLVGRLIFLHTIPLTTLWLPVVLLPLIMLTLGLTWFFAALGVFVRDIGHAIGIVVQMLFFLTPIFYSMQQIPERFHFIWKLNPMATIVDNARRVLMWGQGPDWQWWLATTVLGFLVMVGGYVWLMKSRRGFADVL